jgi:hypothetical protein
VPILVSRRFSATAGRIGGTVFSFLYLSFRALLGALVRSRRGLDSKDIEFLVLRHEQRAHGYRLIADHGRSSSTIRAT